jgi:hypothetical protein
MEITIPQRREKFVPRLVQALLHRVIGLGPFRPPDGFGSSFITLAPGKDQFANMLLGLFKGPLMAVEVFDEHGECS